MSLQIQKAMDLKKEKSIEIKNELQTNKEVRLLSQLQEIHTSLNDKYGFEVSERQLKVLLSSLDAMGITKSIGHNKQWVMLFIRMCLMYNKNPEKKEIYAVTFKSKSGGETFSIIISYFEFIKRAQQSPNFQGFSANLITEKQVGWLNCEGEDKSKWIPKMEPLSINDIRVVFSCRPKNWDRDYVEVFYLREWNKGINEWATKPLPMLQKTAIKNGLAKCFPFEVGELLNMEQDFKDKIEEESQEEELKMLDIKKSLGDFNE